MMKSRIESEVINNQMNIQIELLNVEVFIEK